MTTSKGQNKVPVTDPQEMELNELPGKEFKIRKLDEPEKYKEILQCDGRKY